MVGRYESEKVVRWGQRLAEEAKLEAKRSGILRQAEEMTGGRLMELAAQRSIRLRLQAPAE